MARIGIIINPFAKRNVRRKDQIKAAIEAVGGGMVDVRITRSVEQIEEVGRSFYEQGVEIIGICGGDGSMCVTLSRLLPIWGERPFPMIMPLRGGTMNMVCASAGVKGAPERVVATVVRALRKRGQLRTVERDTLSVEGRSGFLFGAGMSANFLDLYYEGPGTGPWKAFKVLVRGCLAAIVGGDYGKRLWRRVFGKIILRDGAGEIKSCPHLSFSAVLACTIGNLGIGFAPAYRAFERPRFMHLLAAAMKPASIVLRIDKLFWGKPFNSPMMLDEITQHWEFHSDEPIKYFLDGELYIAEDKSLTIEIGHRFKIVSM